jgi:hypothetical protein
VIHVEFNPDKLTGARRAEWLALRKFADDATDDVLRQWRDWLGGGREKAFEATLKAEVWSKLKTWLLEHYFHGKCAYCETRVARFDYHAEHFRPKGAVTFRGKGKKNLEKAKCKDDNGIDVPHPGYFWLAYSWRNLLPSCGFCNTSKGKKTQFPVKADYVGPYVAAGAPLPDEVALDATEEPLLLHPFRDNPREHLVFGVAGDVTAYDDSEKGTNSISVFDLAAEALRIERQKAQDQARVNYLLAMVAAKGTLNDITAAADAFVAEIEKGADAYSAAVVDFLREFRRRFAG